MATPLRPLDHLPTLKEFRDLSAFIRTATYYPTGGKG